MKLVVFDPFKAIIFADFMTIKKSTQATLFVRYSIFPDLNSIFKKLIYFSRRDDGKASIMKGKAMAHRMCRELAFCIEADLPVQNLRKASDKDIVAALMEYEGCGQAMRTLDWKGRLMWRATPEFLREVRQEQKDLEAEFSDGC